MPSSTSSSDMPEQSAEPVFERPLPALGRSALIALLVAFLLLLSWEIWVRSQGVTPSYRNSDGAWAEQRRRIATDAGDGWVFTGSSRVFFNMQLSVWERLDGRRPLQLALEGTAPVAVLEGLAEDQDFTCRDTECGSLSKPFGDFHSRMQIGVEPEGGSMHSGLLAVC